MARPVSGTYRRVDRVRVHPGTTVRLKVDGSSREQSATLHELGMSDLLLSSAQLLRLGTRLSVAITLPGRYLEFEIPGMVMWHLDGRFGVSFDYLTARQTYGLVLAIDVISRAAEDAPNQARGGQR
ncbi:MAG TPA: PilZ domain-containing protein [Polyangiaceae bacterium]|nr:PilZ domain-containing protein [Polyangiaceae bacterium]